MEKNSKVKITWEQIEKLLPETTDLIYIDYNESLDDNIKELQECLSRGCRSGLTETIEFHESSDRSIKEIKKELKSDLISNYNIKRKKAKKLISKYKDEINEYCWDKDTSTPYKDLLRNTSTLIAHYDTGYEMESESWNWSDKEVKKERNKIKKFLKIKGVEHDEGIDMMISQATYGGSLLIYFELDFNVFMENIESAKAIKFDNAMIGIIDHIQGSGDIYTEGIDGIVLPFNNKNVFLEKSIKYNWTYSIAGMCYDWAKPTIVKFSDIDLGSKLEDSPQNKLQKQEEEYNKVFKAGGCTAGDMDIKRHRNVIYRNDYPCGNKCTDCGTFWID